jgi:hypothetical protein
MGSSACGTCKIGAENDEDAVLDSNFRARKMRSLWNVDASIFSKIPSFFSSVQSSWRPRGPAMKSSVMPSEMAEQINDISERRHDRPKHDARAMSVQLPTRLQ